MASTSTHNSPEDKNTNNKHDPFRSLEWFDVSLLDIEPDQPISISVKQQTDNPNPHAKKVKMDTIVRMLVERMQKITKDHKKQLQYLQSKQKEAQEHVQNLAHRIQTLEGTKSTADIKTASIIIPSSSFTIEELPANNVLTTLNTQAIQFNPTTSNVNVHDQEVKRRKQEGVANRKRCRKCFKPFTSNKKAVYHAKRHEESCTSVPCRCLYAMKGKHEHPCTNKNWSKHGDEWRCEEIGCNKAYYAKRTLIQHKKRKH